MIEEKRNYIKEYFSKQEHNFEDLLKVVDEEDTKTINNIKKEIRELLKQVEEKNNELGNTTSKIYSKQYSPMKKRQVLYYQNYSSQNSVGSFDLESGVAINDRDNEKDFVIKVDKKRDEITIISGYDYEKASIVAKRIRYTINRDNTKMAITLLKEYVICFLENKIYCMDFEDNNNISEIDNDYQVKQALKDIRDNEFINTLFNISYGGELNLYELYSQYKNNKSFEIIIKTAPNEIVDKLLSKDLEENIPIYKILGVSQEIYNQALERGIIEEYIDYLETIKQVNEKGKSKKTDKEWLDFIDEIKHYEEDLQFYDISCEGKYYYRYYDNERFDKNNGTLFGAIVNSYNNEEVLYNNYSLGKYMKYVIDETINQGYQRIRDFIEELIDYLKMCQEEEIKPTLYSSYLRQTHDIASRNHKLVVEKENEEIFNSRYKDFKTYYGRRYCVVAPKNSKDLKLEGDNLNHCVASYIKRVIDNECLIYFLRYKDKKDESLITFEVRNNTIVQVRGMHNRRPSKDEIQALRDFATCRKMETNY